MRCIYEPSQRQRQRERERGERGEREGEGAGRAGQQRRLTRHHVSNLRPIARSVEVEAKPKKKQQRKKEERKNKAEEEEGDSAALPIHTVGGGILAGSSASEIPC